jgi:nucleotide-binding universal stress UspA family protein
MFSRAAIATDLSEASDQIVANLHGLAPLGTRRIYLAHAMDMAPHSLSSLGLGYHESLRDDLVRRATSRLNKLREIVEAQGYEASSEILYGPPAATLGQWARTRDIGIIIVGSRGASLAKNILLGSSAVEIVRHSPVPVLLKRLEVKELSGRRHYRLVCRDLSRHILFATDFSPACEGARSYLLDLARNCGADFTILHVDDTGSASGIAHDRLSALKLELEKGGAKHVSIRVTSGDPAAEITHATEAPDVSLAILGTHGRTCVEQFFTGSVSHAVARRTMIPILLIPPLAHEQAPQAFPSAAAVSPA